MSVQQGSNTKSPAAVLGKGTKESKGKDAQKDNISFAKLIAETVRDTLGPRGMDKMLVDSVGDVTITNDGATILKEIDVQHPAAKMMVEIAKSVDNEVGDGTTSVVILAGSLIEKAEDLISKDVHPTIIVDGYRKSATKAIEILNNLATKIDANDKEQLTRIARTSMLTKLISREADEVAEIVVNAVLQVAEQKPDGKGYRVDLDDIKVEKKAGESLADTKLIKGIVLDKEVVHSGMPKRTENAKIALINSTLEIEKIEADAKMASPGQMKMFLEEENRMLKNMIDKIVATRANVVICQKGIDDIAQHYLAKEGILTVRRVKNNDMSKLARATTARIVNNLEDLTSKDLGSADLVEERKVETDKWVFVEGCKHPKAVTVLIRGGSQRVIDEAERSVHDALMVVKDVLEKPAIVVGGGAPESFVAGKIREWANTLTGHEQLAVERFAEALEAIPLTLAENAGMDPIDTLTDLRAKQSKGSKWAGIDVKNARVTDVSKLDIVEPVSVKEQIIKSATEAVSMILRINDVITLNKSAESPLEDRSRIGGSGDISGTIESYPISSILNRTDLKEFDLARRIAIENMESKPEAFRYYLDQNRKSLLSSLENIAQGIRGSIDNNARLSENQHTELMLLAHLKDRIQEDDKRSIQGLGDEFIDFKRRAEEISSKLLPKFMD